MAENDPDYTLGFAEERAVFKGPTQNARVLTEGWVADHLFCPNCGEARLMQQPPNRPAADFLCRTCDQDYELKSKHGRLGRKVVDGALSTMLERVRSERTPNLLLMTYGRQPPAVTNLIVVPKQFLTADLIEPKKPTWPKGRSAPWVGCNILLEDVPTVGRIDIVRDGAPLAKAEVLDRWERTRFVRDAAQGARGWLLAVLRCVERLPPAFTLQDVYAFEPELRVAPRHFAPVPHRRWGTKPLAWGRERAAAGVCRRARAGQGDPLARERLRRCLDRRCARRLTGGVGTRGVPC